jgi:hypothetical protein
MRHAVLLTLFLALSALLHAAPRPWKSADGKRSFQGEFVERDSTNVTIQRSDRKRVVLPIGDLHPDDLAWLDLNHPVAAGTPADTGKPCVFDCLCFGDSRNDVLAKLKTSKFVELTVDEVYLGRTGLNGAFRTRKKIGGLDATLSFDWTDSDGLREVSLQTDSFPAADLNTKMVPCWKEFLDLLNTLHGKPISEVKQLQIGSIQEGTMVATHLWKLEPSGSAMLGAAKDEGNYQVVVRFTTKNVQPVLLP